MTPFDFLNAINTTKEDMMVDEDCEKAYTAFMVNRGLSQFPDTVLFANEMNQRASTPARMQFDFFLNTISKRKRFGKWAKSAADADIQLVADYYGYSYDKARNAISLLTDEQLNELRKRLDKGGQRKR